MKPDWVYADVAANQSIYEIAGTNSVEAFINGKKVAPELHRLTKVKDNAHVILWPVPRDDEQRDDLADDFTDAVESGADAIGDALSNDIVRAVATIGIAIAAPYAASALTGATSGFAFYATSAGIAAAGNFALNQLVPPQIPDIPSYNAESFNRLESLTGSSNRLAAFRPVPRLYGTFKIYPPIPMTARPYTEIQGKDQYIRMLVCLGYGPLDIGGVTVGPGQPIIDQNTSLTGTPVRIGETNINDLEGVEFEIGNPDQMTLYTDQIIEEPTGFTTGFTNEGELDSNGVKVENISAIRTTQPDADEISIDFSGRLYSVNDEAKTRNAKVFWKIEYREVGQSDWIVQEEEFVISSSRKETVREGYRWTVPTGQYDVRLTRLRTEHAATNAIANSFTWSALRTIRSVQAFDVENTIVMSLRIKATDQLNGRVDDLSIEATSVLPVWNGSEWVEEPTNNPAWIYSDIWTGTANRRPLPKSDLDTDALSEWAEFCDTEGFKYNGVFDAGGTTLDRAREVAGCGLASWAFSPDSKVTVVRDTVQSIPKMIISPRNSFGFRYQFANVDVPEGLRVRFIDSETYENTERLVFDDGYDTTNATQYETLEAKGVTDPDQAWKYGRFHIAQQRLRPERYTFSQDIQHLRYKRGDLLTLQYDVILVGIAAGRIANVISDTEIEIDEQVVDGGDNYGVKIQHKDGTISTVGCTPSAGPLNKTLTLDSAVSNLEEDDLVVFGVAGQETIDVKVTSIEPQGDLIAAVTCVPAAPNVLDAFTGNIPDFDPVITDFVDPNRVLPKQPTIDDIRSDEGALYVDDDGSLRVRMLVETSLGSFPGWDQLTQLRYRPVGDNNWESTNPTSASSISVLDVDEGVDYEIQVRGVKGALVSAWSDSVTHTVIGKTTPPPNVETFNAVQNGENVVFRWRDVIAPDIEGYEIRYGPRQTATWESSIRIVEANKSNTIAQADVPPGDYKFFIKALDTSGNFSREATERLLVVKTEFELLDEVEHSPDWDTGWFTGFEKVGSALEVSRSLEGFYISDEYDTGFDADDLRLYALIDAGLSDVENVVDNGLITANVLRETDNLFIDQAATATVDNGELLVGLPVSDPFVFHEISTRNTGERYSDPNATLINYQRVSDQQLQSESYGSITEDEDSFDTYDTLMGWTEWTRGEIDARYVLHRARIRKQSFEEGAKLLRRFKTVTDVPERIERQNDKAVAPGGTTFTFNRRFHFTPTVVGIVESDDALFPIRKNVSDTEVTFVVRDSAGNDVGADKFDFIATGA